MHPTAQKVAAAAQSLSLDISLKEFEETTRTAEDAARAIGCQVAQIVKSLLFVVDEQPLLVLMSGASRLDEKKLAGLLGVGRKKVKRGSVDMVRDVTGFAIGGVPPFGHQRRLPTYFDADLLQFETIWAAAGTPHTVFAVGPQALAEATGSQIADLKTT